MEFFHKKCGGGLVLDVSNIIAVRTKSISISGGRMSLGMLEVGTRPGSHSCQFICQKCNDAVELDDKASIQMKCPVCRQTHSVSAVLNTNILPVICDDCLQVLQGKKEGNDNQKELAGYLHIPDKIIRKYYSDLLTTITIS